MEREFINFVVGGMTYSLLLEDIKKYWGSYFNNVIKNDWSSKKDDPIKIDRDGRMFRYITEFYHHDELAFKSQKPSLELVRKIQAEAEFFNLSSLVEACETYAVSRIDKHLDNRTITCSYHNDDVDHLVNVLGKVWAPYCNKGYKTLPDGCTILMSSTPKSINIDELCEVAIPYPRGEGNESLAFEIPADQLNPELWSHFEVENYQLHKFAPRMKYPIVEGTYARATIEDATRDKIYTALDRELKKYEHVVISLTHLYPMCQVDTSCLRGGDALLYQLLAERENDYKLSIVPVKVKASIDEDEPSSSYLTGSVVDLEYEFSRQVTHNDEENGSTLL
eukprot:gene20318-23082_t